MNNYSEIQKMISSHGSSAAAYAISVAFHAAVKLYDEHPNEFEKEFGILGVEIIRQFAPPNTKHNEPI